ncbi:tetratricopeptide repeat protein [Bacteroidales bacterium OttesenSCG-928-I21]|nr:tetratricopeptide repeat protein [Bacteroidales bacterium OttesenSCG-928-I21]
MKKIGILLVVVLISVSGFSQKSKVTSAWNFLKDGYLSDAKKVIDEAEVHAQTSEWYKTFYYKGQIYQQLGITTNKKYQALCEQGCLDISYEAYLKSVRLNLRNPEDKKLDLTNDEGFLKFVKIISENDERNFEDSEALIDILTNRFPALSNAFVNRGADKFQTGNYSEAYGQFEKAMNIATLSFRVDTQLIHYASMAAFRSEKYKEAIKLNELLIKLNYGGNEKEKVGIVIEQSRAYQISGDTLNMLKTLEKGIEKHPNDNYPLVIEMFNYYVNINEAEKAFNYINLAIEKNPNDPQFYVIKGSLLEEMKQKKEAQVEYEKAIELSPDNFDANLNLGAFYFNSAVDTIEWAEVNVPINEFAKMDEYKVLANKLFESALPYLEKAYTIQPKNINVLNTLRTIYYRLGRTEEFTKIKNELDAITE